MPYCPSELSYREKNLKGVSLDGVKKCGTCKTDWPKSHFHLNLSKKDGLLSQCKYCHTVYKSIHLTRKDKSVFITNEEYHSLLDMNCVWCSLKGGTVDRWHSDLNYIRANVVPACWQCNSTKGARTVKCFIQWLQRFKSDYKPNIQYNDDYDLTNPPLGIDI